MSHILYLNFLNYTIQALITVFFLMSMLTPRIKGVYAVILFVLGMLGTAVIFIDVTQDIPLKMIVTTVVLVSLIVSLFRDRIMMKLFTFVMLMIISYIAEIIAFFLLKALHFPDIRTLSNYSELRVVGLTYFNVVAFGLVMLMILVMRKFKFKIRVENLAIFSLFPVSQVVLLGGFLYSSLVYNDVLLLNIGITGILLSVIADFVLLHTINTTSEKLIAEEKLAFAETRRELENDYYELMRYHLKELELKRHDYRNQLQVIYGLLVSDDDSSRIHARRMLDIFVEDAGEKHRISYCSNAIVNTIMAVKAKYARSLGIDTTIEVNIPENIDILDSDLSSLFLNLFDNAIEACSRIDDSEIKKHIIIKASYMANYMVIKITNPTVESIEGKIEGMLESRKENSKGHGYGLKIIDRIVSKYDGDLDMKVEAGIFTTKAALRINRQEETTADAAEL